MLRLIKLNFLTQRHIVKLFFHNISWNRVSGKFPKKQKLSWNTFALISKFHCVCSSSVKKMCILRMYILKFNSFKGYLLRIKQNQKLFKETKMYLNLKTGSTKVHVLNRFSKLLLTHKLQHYLRMNAYHTIENIDFHKLITYTSYITYIYN